MLPGNLKAGQQSLGACCVTGSKARDNFVPLPAPPPPKKETTHIVLPPGPRVGKTKEPDSARSIVKVLIERDKVRDCEGREIQRQLPAMCDFSLGSYPGLALSTFSA